MKKTAILEKVAQRIEETTLYRGVKVMNVKKNNGVEKIGLTFPINDTMSANLYVPENIIDALLEGSLEVDVAASELVKQFNKRGDNPIERQEGKDLLSSYIDDKQKLLDHTRCVVVNAFKNQHLRTEAPYKVVLDLLVVYRVFIDDTSSFLLSNTVMKEAGVTIEELEEAAFRNSRQNYRMSTMLETLTALRGIPTPDCFIPNDDPLNLMRVVTNESKVWGASAIADPNYLDTVSKSYGGTDFVILPSSVNEIITLPMMPETDIRDLIEIVKEVNSTEVNPTEFLSDSVYIYKADKHELMLEA